ncbi:hypothetical protein SAMN05421630_1011042 [Prauserella marina]|uniref:Uncharacterized protein n=1 Tax=Prauserella marina TaxID=530584 RepID=A0A1G6K7U7_9PSEU|nr:hypothetical protein DES30_101295 [Prauserella marina]SDC26396.1 hypothetical protein SAMN05421630_1011042 [Prauserella marina]
MTVLFGYVLALGPGNREPEPGAGVKYRES